MSRRKQRSRVRPPIRLNHTNNARGPVAERQPGRGVLGPRQPGRGFFTGAMSLLLLCCFFIGAGKTYAQEPGQLSIRTVAEDSYSGFLRVRLARNESEYIGETGAYLEESIPMSGESATVSFRDVEPGRYAVALYLDTDEDGELDTNLFGVPQEPIGFSRNPRIGMSRPGFSETAFDYPGGKLTVDIELKD